MRDDQARELDDFMRAKKHLAVELQLDSFLQGMVEKFLREDCRVETRMETAKALVNIAEEKDSPGGWLRSVLESGKALSAIRAVASRDYRMNKRDGDFFMASKHEVRMGLRKLYENRHGPLREGSKILDRDGGMPWEFFHKEDPHIAKAMQNFIARRLTDLAWVEENEEMGLSYKFVPRLGWDIWGDAIAEFEKAHHGAAAAGIQLGADPIPARTQRHGTQVEAIEL